MLATVVEDGVLRSNPAAGVRISKPSSAVTAGEGPQRRALTRTELRAFLDACDPEWRPFFELLAHTGLRISEALELRWGDVDLAAGTLKVRRQVYRGQVAAPKSRLGKRDLPLSPGAAAELRAREGWPDALVFAAVTGEHLALTLRTYVHLMDEGLGDAAFLDEVTRGAPVGALQAAPATPGAC